MIWVIIPAFNEEKALPKTLDALFQQSGGFRVVVVDGGSTDGTRELISQDPRISAVDAPKGRARQMNAGADYVTDHRQSQDDWLLFLHADTILPEDAMQRLTQLNLDSHCQAGGFMHQFSGRDWPASFDFVAR